MFQKIKDYVQEKYSCKILVDNFESAGTGANGKRITIESSINNCIVIRYVDSQDNLFSQRLTWNELEEKLAGLTYQFHGYTQAEINRRNNNPEWCEVTGQEYEDMLCAVPPKGEFGKWFVMGEAQTHCRQTSHPVYLCFKEVEGRYFVKMMTIQQYLDEYNQSKLQKISA